MSIPGAVNPLLLGGGDQQYKIERSLRFNSADSAYLSRTPASAGNRKTWTWAGWVKRSALGSGTQSPFSSSDGTSATTAVYFGVHSTYGLADALTFYTDRTGVWVLTTAAVFRDTSAWYHIVISVDTTQATSTNRVKIYVNGAEQALSGTYPTQDFETEINRASFTHSLGRHVSAGWYFSGYLADIHFIDGQALTPSSFTEVSATTGQLIPKAYSGGYGTNGFHLPFSNNSTAAALGTDTSGNSNTWTVNNISVAAGANNDSLVDTPTSYGTDTGAGGEVRGNYATLNPLDTGTVTLANGNLDATFGTSARGTRATFGVSTGKYYFEMTVGGFGTNGPAVGVAYANANITTSYAGSDANAWVYNGGDGKIYNNGIGTGSNAEYATTDVIGVAINMDSGTVTFYKNNSAQPSTVTGLSGTVFPVITSGGTAGVQYCNFGQRPFAYTAPSGFKALCDTNLPEPTIADGSTAMDVKLYTGNGSTQTISGLGFSPDLVWWKNRTNGTIWHNLVDRVRGAEKMLFSNDTSAEFATNLRGTLTAFTSNGFTMTAGSDDADNANATSVPYVAWTWDAGSSTVTNTDGSITSQVRANPSAGFSIVTYTGNGTAGTTIGHGLGIAPSFIVCKSRSNSSPWLVYHKSIGNTAYLLLNATDAAFSPSVQAWNNTTPSANVFTVGTGASVNSNGSSQVAYCFAPVAGYSAFGSYTGNGSTDGPFVYTGFRPKWLLIKNTTGTNSWELYDAVRDPNNVVGKVLLPNTSDAEITNAGATPGVRFDLLSNGFKVRDSQGSVNGSTNQIIYAAFAENPFQYARAR